MSENAAGNDEWPDLTTIAELLEELTSHERAVAAILWDGFAHMRTEIDLVMWERAMNGTTARIRMAVYDGGNIVISTGSSPKKVKNPFAEPTKNY